MSWDTQSGTSYMLQMYVHVCVYVYYILMNVRYTDCTANSSVSNTLQGPGH